MLVKAQEGLELLRRQRGGSKAGCSWCGRQAGDGTNRPQQRALQHALVGVHASGMRRACLWHAPCLPQNWPAMHTSI